MKEGVKSNLDPPLPSVLLPHLMDSPFRQRKINITPGNMNLVTKNLGVIYETSYSEDKSGFSFSFDSGPDMKSAMLSTDLS